MKTKEFAALARKLLPQLPGMVVHGPMVLVTPIGPVLRGLCFEGSSFNAKSFYLWAFWLPLYIPTSYISFNLGKRIRDESGGDGWDATDTRLMEDLAKAICSEAIPFLHGLETPQGVVRRARLAAAESSDPYAHEALAYALAKAAETAAAVDAIDVLLGLLHCDISWEAQLGAKVTLLKAKLLANPGECATMLEAWQAESIRALGLEKIA